MFLTQAWSVLSAILFPSPTTMGEVSSPLPLIFSTCRDFDTELFFSILWSEVKRSPDPTSALNDFRVTSMNFRKTKNSAEHEFLTAQVSTGNESQNYHHLILERTVSNDYLPGQKPDNGTIDDFLNHQGSKKLLDMILYTIQSLAIPPSIAVSAAVAAAPAIGSASVLIPLSITSPSLDLCLPLTTNEVIAQARPPQPQTLTSTVPDYSYVDQASMAMAKVLQQISETRVGAYSSRLIKNKPPKDSPANDRFFGSDRVNMKEYNYGVQIGEFQPKTLNLFHLALLAHVVHQESPLYALFMSQCYWFSSTVFYAAQIIDRDLTRDATPPSYLPRDDWAARGSSNLDQADKHTDEFFYPFHLYMPPEAGCWKGMRITGCKEVVLSIIVQKFHRQLQGYKNKVSLYYFIISDCLLNL